VNISEIIDYLLLSWAGKLAPASSPARPARIRDARDGTVRIRGNVRPSGGHLLRAPVTGRRCVGFHLIVYEWRPLRSQDRRYDVLLDLEEACPFFVADGSAEAFVDTSAPMDLDLQSERRALSRRRNAELDALIQLLSSRGISTENALGIPRLISYEEGILAENHRVSVTGIGLHEVSLDGESSGPREPPQRLTLRGTAAAPLLVSNTPAALR
jgi:hypothetical protein